MRKTLLATVLAGAFAAPAWAQTTIKIYGKVDAGLVSESGGAAGSVTNLNSGIASGSRIGFKGSEDLGGGLSANFVLENGFNVDKGTAGQGGLLFGRQAFVGLNGHAGIATFGRQYSPYYKVLRDVADPFAAGLAGKAGNIMETNSRVNNMAEYVSPRLGGVYVDTFYGFGEVAGDSTKSRSLGGALRYANGPIEVALAHHQLNNAAGTDSAKNTLLAGRYDFGVAKASFGYAINKGTGTEDSRDALFGVAVPFGASKVLASYIRHDDRSAANSNATQWALGYFYSLSKRTSLYTSYARIDNSNGATYTVGNATDKGTGDKAFNLGILHAF
jgi:predicted porin